MCAVNLQHDVINKIVLLLSITLMPLYNTRRLVCTLLDTTSCYVLKLVIKKTIFSCLVEDFLSVVPKANHYNKHLSEILVDHSSPLSKLEKFKFKQHIYYQYHKIEIILTYFTGTSIKQLTVLIFYTLNFKFINQSRNSK